MCFYVCDSIQKELIWEEEIQPFNLKRVGASKWKTHINPDEIASNSTPKKYVYMWMYMLDPIQKELIGGGIGAGDGDRPHVNKKKRVGDGNRKTFINAKEGLVTTYERERERRVRREMGGVVGWGGTTWLMTWGCLGFWKEMSKGEL